MPLEDLQKTIETLQELIRTHGSDLGKSETLTRYALIDPLLRALGWDTSNPAQVVPEYPSSGGRADYALLATNGAPAMMVEAKKLGERMEGAVSQGINYCLEKGTLYFTVTDGRVWELYETHKPVPVNEKRIVEFDVTGATAEVCLKSLALWRPSVEQGKVRAGEAPVLVNPVSKPKSPPQGPTEEHPQTKQPNTPVKTNSTGVWTGLDRLTAVKGTAPPTALQFPDRSSVGIERWAHLPERALEWLYRTNRFRKEQCPIIIGKRHLVNTRPIHPNGKEFVRGKSIGSLWIEANYSASDQLRNACAIIEHARMNPAQFKVQF